VFSVGGVRRRSDVVDELDLALRNQDVEVTLAMRWQGSDVLVPLEDERAEGIVGEVGEGDAEVLDRKADARVIEVEDRQRVVLPHEVPPVDISVDHLHVVEIVQCTEGLLHHLESSDEHRVILSTQPRDVGVLAK